MQAIVGLGGSAGSIGALKTFFSHMPGDSGLAFVVVYIFRLRTKAT
jgi:two-component system CheB/CheR fusion protein